MLPLLVFGLHVPPIIAVGSDATVNFLSKIGAGYVHWRQGSVNWRLVGYLAAGSIPGTFLGVGALAYLRTTYGAHVNDFLRPVLAAVLVGVSTLLLIQTRPSKATAMKDPGSHRGSLAGASLIGLLAGFLVGMTSIGAGTVVMMLLLLVYRFEPKVLVGTDIVHAVALTGVTSALQYRLGIIDFSLVGALLIGSIPGVLLGARLTARVPVLALRRGLCVVLFGIGTRMFWA